MTLDVLLKEYSLSDPASNHSNVLSVDFGSTAHILVMNVKDTFLTVPQRDLGHS